MDDLSFRCLLQREILDLLIGDVILEREQGFRVALPYLSGNTIKSRAIQFGMSQGSWSGGSRWNFMSDLITYAIQEQRVSDLLTYWFNKEHFKDLTYLESANEIENAYQHIVLLAMEKINKFLVLSNQQMVYIGNQYQIIPSDAKPILAGPIVSHIDVAYIHSLTERCTTDLLSENYDSVITKSRTLIEEILHYILERNNVESESKGDIKKLYKEFKTLYNMNANKGFDERVNRLLSGLETILQAIAEMRNINSDAHGVGKSRIQIKERDARLVINSAIIFSEFMLETYQQKEEQYGSKV